MGALALIVALVMMPSVVTAQDDPLRTARDLYASAAYEEALAELARVESSPETPATMRDKDAYRVFCLVALGRAVEAQERAESLVRSNPLLSVDQFPDASPRIATIFTAVQRRVLPPLVKEAYRTARARALENASDARSRLMDVRSLLAMAERVTNLGIPRNTVQQVSRCSNLWRAVALASKISFQDASGCCCKYPTSHNSSGWMPAT